MSISPFGEPIGSSSDPGTHPDVRDGGVFGRPLDRRGGAASPVLAPQVHGGPGVPHAHAEATRSGKTVYAFGLFELDESLYELRRSGIRVNVQPKVLMLILYLVKERDRVVPKRELFDALWPGQTVGASSLTKAVRSARVALGDAGALQTTVRTVPTCGYRFAMAVHELVDLATRAPPVSAHPSDRSSVALEDTWNDTFFRLSSACQRTVTAAALIGYEFSETLLSRVTLLPQHELGPLLHEATSADVLHASVDAKGRYVFAHARTRDRLLPMSWVEAGSPTGQKKVR